MNKKWDAEAVRVLHAHPDWTCEELAEVLGTTAKSVESARHRFGRFGGNADALCVVCDSRPVFAESRQAKRMRLCKGCYLKERERRLQEERESVAVRQAVKRQKRRSSGDA